MNATYLLLGTPLPLVLSKSIAAVGLIIIGLTFAIILCLIHIITVRLHWRRWLLANLRQNCLEIRLLGLRCRVRWLSLARHLHSGKCCLKIVRRSSGMLWRWRHLRLWLLIVRKLGKYSLKAASRCLCRLYVRLLILLRSSLLIKHS